MQIMDWTVPLAGNAVVQCVQYIAECRQVVYRDNKDSLWGPLFLIQFSLFILFLSDTDVVFYTGIPDQCYCINNLL